MGTRIGDYAADIKLHVIYREFQEAQVEFNNWTSQNPSNYVLDTDFNVVDTKLVITILYQEGVN